MAEALIYPSWRYHPDFEPLLVQTAGEDEALGSGWVDTPAKFPPPPQPRPDQEMTVLESLLAPKPEQDEEDAAVLAAEEAEATKRRPKKSRISF